MTSPVVPVAYQQQPLIPLGPAAFHSQYTPVFMSCSEYLMVFVSACCLWSHIADVCVIVMVGGDN